MTAKEYLSQAIQLKRKIKVMQLDLEQLQGLACSVPGVSGGQCRSSGCGDRVGKAAAKIADLENDIATDIEKYIKVRAEIVNVINNVGDPRYTELLHYRYILGYTWEQIAVEMNFSYQWVCLMHGKALEKAAQFIKF